MQIFKQMIKISLDFSAEQSFFNQKKFINKYKMPKTFIISIDYNYPFQLKQLNRIPPNSLIKIIRCIPLTQLNKNKEISVKILFSHSLRNKNLIRIESVQEKIKNMTAHMEICFQYIETPLIPKNTQFWKALLPQLQTFLLYLANIGVKISLNVEKVGVTCQGVLKYYLGLQFQLSGDQEETFLQLHYEKQIAQFKKKFIVTKQQQNLKVIPYSSKEKMQRNLEQKYRKASVATLPSKIPNFLSLSNQLNRIKNSVRQISQYHRWGYETKQSYQEQENTIIQNDHRLRLFSPSENVSPKKELVRKYSGDSKAWIYSNRKLSAKFSDFRSDRKKSKQFNQQSLVKITGSNGKSRIQQLKYQEYIELTKSQKTYLNDFLSVLEDGDFNAKQSTQYQLDTTEGQPSIESTLNNNYEICLKTDVALLTKKAQQSIKNSLKIIKKVKGIC